MNQTLLTGKLDGQDHKKMSMEIVTPDEVLGVVKMHGPLLPLDVRKYLKKGDSITIGATLSQLSASKRVKLTNVKRGGSPYYYVDGQESKLVGISDNLNEKDKRAFDLLQDKKVLREKVQDPLTRVCLQQIKDYSRSFTVNVNGVEEKFWRYYLINEQEAIQILRNQFSTKKEETAVEQSTKISQQPVRQHEVELRPASKTTDVLQSDREQKKAEPKIEEKQIEKPKVSELQKATSQATEQKHEEQSSLSQEILPEIKDDFLDKLKKFFKNHDINVIDAKLIRKGSEYDFIIEMKTPVGQAEYYCKAKSKKKCADGDLSQAYLQGQTRRIPTVFITTGEVTKKAKEKLKTDYKGMMLKEI